jgi:isoleucyl-tRNA synthetase
MPPATAPAQRFAPLPEGYTASPDAAEREVLELWSAERTFESLQAARATARPFVFWEGPPTANGRPGIHHVLARTLKDAVCRFHSMLGERVDRKAGWDTHGLPVELEVEKALGISGKSAIESLPLDPATGRAGVARFNDECRKSVWKYKDEWERLSARQGYWLDYGRPYVTYDPDYIDSVWNLLARMQAEGLIYRGKRVLPWCGRCGTGLSSHELGQPGVYKDVLDPSVHVRFPSAARQGAELESFLAWTTTPWTLPSNIALAVHPALEYVLARVALPVEKGEAAGARGYERVWIAADRAQAVLGEAFEVLERASGKELAGRRYVPPFARAFDGGWGASALRDNHEGQSPPRVQPGSWAPDEAREFSLVAAEFVTATDGTGIVHQAPAYGADDWGAAQRAELPVPQAVGADGRFAVAPAHGVESGTFFKDADDALMGDLKARGFLFRKARESHSYPHCWRCSTPLLYFAAPAWFIRTTALKASMLEHNARIRWVPPEVGTSRFGEWLENNVDWNISRDRYWGTPLPFWICSEPSCDHELAVPSAGELARLAGSLPQGFDSHKPSVDEVAFPCPKCGRGTMRRTPAVLDCWFDSGAMPFAQQGWPQAADSERRLRDQFPADFICEGLDQTRGWFYTLHAIGTFALRAEPELGPGPAYRTCLVNGLVLDKDGVKMSKRLGNVVDPWKVIGEHGADAVRWYLVASAAPWLPKRFDPNGLLEVRRRFFSTLANSYQFFREYARLDGFDPRSSAIPPVPQWPAIDRWLLSRTHSLAAEVRRRLTEVDLSGAARAVEGFVVDELSNWYIRRNRRRFWKGESGPDKLAAFSALHQALRASALLIAPLAPFLSEMLWRRLEPGAGSVHAELLPTADVRAVDRDLEASMALVQELVVMGRALREKVGIRVRQPLRALHVRCSDAEALRLLQSSFASAQILDELNVKGWGSLGLDDGKLCRLTAKANFKLLGKRLGARMKAAAAAIAALPAADLARLRAGEGLELDVEGEPVALSGEDVLVQVESQADFPVETDGRFVLWLDTELDEELAAEGLAREVVVRVNALRKEAGLAVEQRIALRLSSGDARLLRALERHRALLANETLAVELELRATADAGGAPDARAEWELEPGVRLACSLARA